MLSVKGLGIVILTLTALYYSYNGQRQELHKQQILAALHDLFRYVRQNIECYTIPLGEIYRNCSSPILEQTGFLVYWKRGELTDAVNTLPDLPEGTESALQHYAENAGGGNKDTELRLCRSVQDELEEALRIQNASLKTKNKLYRTLPFLLVLSVVLLLG